MANEMKKLSITDDLIRTIRDDGEVYNIDTSISNKLAFDVSFKEYHLKQDSVHSGLLVFYNVKELVTEPALEDIHWESIELSEIMGFDYFSEIDTETLKGVKVVIEVHLNIADRKSFFLSLQFIASDFEWIENPK